MSGTDAVRSGAAATHVGYFHEALFYGSDDELLAAVVPFIEEGLAAGEPTLVVMDERRTELVSAVLPDPRVRFLDHQYLSPAATIREYRRIFTALMSEGAQQIRVVGEVPHPGVGVSWESWRRYEAVVNYAFDDFPVWGLCPYDLRITSPEVIDDVRRTHPWVSEDGEPVASPTFEDPRRFLAERHSIGFDQLEMTTTRFELADPTPSDARRAVERVAASHGRLDEEDRSGLCIAVSEVVTNATMHGRPPVVVRCWADDRRVVVTVRDQGSGPGPERPFVGLVQPAGDGLGGLGLWIAHQSCADVVLRTDESGFTVVLSAGDPPPPLVHAPVHTHEQASGHRFSPEA